MAYTDHAGDIFRVTMAFDVGGGQVQECDIHYRVASAGAGDSRPAVLSYVNSGYDPYLKPYLPTTTSYYGSKISTIKALAAWSPLVVYVNVAGTNADPTLPTQDRGLVSWKTAYSGRAYRGRTYLPTPSTDSLTTTGKVATTTQTAWTAWAAYMISPIVSGGTTWIPGVYHRKPTADISSTFDQFTSAIVSDLFATQRRGGQYGRPNQLPF